jgi:hypothetical protein
MHLVYTRMSFLATPMVYPRELGEISAVTVASHVASFSVLSTLDRFCKFDLPVALAWRCKWNCSWGRYLEKQRLHTHAPKLQLRLLVFKLGHALHDDSDVIGDMAHSDTLGGGPCRYVVSNLRA